MSFLPEQQFSLKKEISLLPKKDEYLLVADFDDTIFSRYEQLHWTDQISIWLQNHRWNIWNSYIQEVIWIKKFIKKYYIHKKYPQEIAWKLRKHTDLILTAGFKKIQEEKVKAVWLGHINLKVVFEWKQKPLELVKYIINTLNYIPNKITVFEDRPECFIENKNVLEDILGTKVEIILVTMPSNNESPITKKLA